METTGSNKFITITNDNKNNNNKNNSTNFSLESQSAARNATIATNARNDTVDSYVPSAVAIGLTSADLEKPPDLRNFQNSFEKSKTKYFLNCCT